MDLIQGKYSFEDLFNLGPQKVYKQQFLEQISIPIGGIGTGSIGLTGRGSLIDFEIFNRPNKGSKYPKTFPMIRVKEHNKEPVCRILEGPIQRPYTPIDGGAFHSNGEGFPHMDRCEFRGEFPFALINFYCEKMPVKIELEAYNPFIPSDPDASSYPILILQYSVTNVSKDPVNVSILWSLLNMVGTGGKVPSVIETANITEPKARYNNIYIENERIKGIFFTNHTYNEEHPLFGSMALLSPEKEISVCEYWQKGQWFASHYHIWNTFKETGKVSCTRKKSRGKQEAGAIAISKTLNGGESQKFNFYITWYFPNFIKYWQEDFVIESTERRPVWKNYYASLFNDAFDVADKFSIYEPNNYKYSLRFHDALFNSTFPPYIIDAIASNLSTLNTNTCLRLSDGSFYGWEGTSDKAGWCEGSCSHVWGYQQALPFLFPSLERSMHDLNYNYNFFYENSGALGFRLQIPLGTTSSYKTPCADGQFGGIIHVYREWKISGNDNWLKNLWPKIKLALEYAWEKWDKDRKGYLDLDQFNTYDLSFYGPNPMLTCYYVGALHAAAKMGEYLNDQVSSKLYTSLYEKGRKWVDENLFNGEYYIQRVDLNKNKSQIGNGCLIDQLIGQQLARIAGMKNFLNTKNIQSTLKSIFKYNWKLNMRAHENGGRLYAVNDESATVICTWPKGDRPKVPFTYADEVMNGFEYQFAVHCILEGLLEEGLTVVKSIRDRFDGYGRNPYDEFECGHHYARSLASYGLLIALSGFEYDLGQGYIGFSPALNVNQFKTFWSLNKVWGEYSQNQSKATIKILFGKISLKKMKIKVFKDCTVLEIITASKKFNVNCDKNGFFVLPNEIILEEGQKIDICVS